MAVIAELLECEGPGFHPVWGQLFTVASRFQDADEDPRRAPQELFDLASEALSSWPPLEIARARGRLRNALVGLRSVPLLGFCAYGLLTAQFWKCFSVAQGTPAAGVARCLQRLTSGPVATQSWGPLEFSQSARWPLKILDVRLLQEHWAGCAGRPVAACPEVTAARIRAGLGLSSLPSAGQPSQRPMVPVAREVRQSAHAALSPGALVRFVVIGSHAGSNMEPLSLLVAALRRKAVHAQATVYGTRYPFPELMCQSFGQCRENALIDEAVGLLVQQMYAPTWAPSDLLSMLSSAMTSDEELQAANLIVCAQPMAICALLRGIVDLPMLVYQAFPLVGATPAQHKHTLLLAFKEMMQTPGRSIFVAYSKLLAGQFARQLGGGGAGAEPLCLRPSALYATQEGRVRYDPDRQSPRVLVSRFAGWARDGSLALVHLWEAFAERDLQKHNTRIRFIFLGMNRDPSEWVAGVVQPFNYAELRRFRAAVYFPWDMGMLVFNELYSIGVPLLLPSRAWIASIIKRMLEYTDFGWWQIRNDSAAVLPHVRSAQAMSPVDSDGMDRPWPWLGPNASISQILELYDQTDFVRWPYILSFGSLAELMVKVATADFDVRSGQMQIWNNAMLESSLGIASRALDTLLGEAPLDFRLNESSCI